MRKYNEVFYVTYNNKYKVPSNKSNTQKYVR